VQLQDVERLDVVWDTYKDESLKETARKERGIGVRKKVSEKTGLPCDWNNFLRNNLNKSELFSFLSRKIIGMNIRDKAIYTTLDDSILTLQEDTENPLNIFTCNHEEADTR